MKNYTLECCVESVESAIAAMEGGAGRLELCSGLSGGGITPGLNLYRQVDSFCHLPVHVLIRPRFGDFCYTRHERAIIKADVCTFAQEGAHGVVIGALTPDGRLDMPFLRELVACAEGASITLHRAFDMCADPFEALEQAIELGITTILTSGQRSTATEGAPLIAQLHRAAAGRIAIMAGSGVSSKNVEALAGVTGVTAFHLSAKAPLESAMTFRRSGLCMGSSATDEYTLWRTDSREVSAVDHILKKLPDLQ
ncbi:MAG: copper homeostasis protein CutC [Angelakisella sp.]